MLKTCVGRRHGRRAREHPSRVAVLAGACFHASFRTAPAPAAPRVRTTISTRHHGRRDVPLGRLALPKFRGRSPVAGASGCGSRERAVLRFVPLIVRPAAVGWSKIPFWSGHWKESGKATDVDGKRRTAPTDPGRGLDRRCRPLPLFAQQDPEGWRNRFGEVRPDDVQPLPQHRRRCEAK